MAQSQYTYRFDNAMSEFQTHCALPNTTVNYVSSPDTRGSFELVWNCFSTLIACVYTVLHFNIPARGDDAQEGELWLLRIGNYKFIRRRAWMELTFWCLLTIFIPEIAYTSALLEFGHALDERDTLRGELAKKFPALSKDVINRWTIRHTFYANMGGFVILYESPANPTIRGAAKIVIPDPSHILDASKQQWRHAAAKFGLHDHADSVDEQDDSNDGDKDPRAVAFSRDNHTSASAPEIFSLSSIETKQEAVSFQSAIDGIFPNESGTPRPPISIAQSQRLAADTDLMDKKESASPKDDPIWMRSPYPYRRYHLNAVVLRKAIGLGLIRPEAVPSDDIKDQASTDWFARILVMLQLISFFVDIVARLAQDLPISALEVVVCAFAICSIIPYLIQWYKPRNVAATIPLATYYEIPQDIRDQKKESRTWGFRELRALAKLPPFRRKDSDDNADNDWKPPTAIDPPVKNRVLDKYWILLLCWGGTLFGAIHLAAWNVEFPSDVDRWLWRGSSIATTALPLVWGLVAGMRYWVGTVKDKKDNPDGKKSDDGPKNESQAENGTKAPWDKKFKKDGRSTAAAKILGILDAAWKMVFFFGLAAYVVGRGILVVEMLRTLFYLPPRAYRLPNWTAGIPHIG